MKPLLELSRAERRRLERNQANQTKTCTLTQAQLDQKLKVAEMEATKKSLLDDARLPAFNAA